MKEPLRIAIASGKGGTGKTTVATNLAHVLVRTGRRVAYVDCDVEEPNGHLFLHPVIEASRDVTLPVPEVDESRCTLCGACGRACRYSAIACLPARVLTFPRLCHGCGGCLLACCAGAIREVPRRTGVVETGHCDSLVFVHGRLDVGEAMAPPVIRAVLERCPSEGVLIMDAPPGTSCPAIEAVRTADVVLLVTEPTPFGLSDLRLAVDMVRVLGLPFAVAVNRVGVGDAAVNDYCREQGIEVVLELANDRDIARAYSRGQLAVQALPALGACFDGLLEQLERLAAQGAAPVGQSSLPVDAQALSAMGRPFPSELAERKPRRQVPEIVVVSGKGGTGKTSVSASLAALAQGVAVADCDVDAADLYLVLGPQVREQWPFASAKAAVIDPERCNDCGRCVEVCRFDAVQEATHEGRAVRGVDVLACEGCGVCVDQCPQGAVALVTQLGGAWFVSDTRVGPMVHARLGAGAENSGKLVSLVRREAKAEAQLHGSKLLVSDGSPGIGCPVISSLTGATLALVVTEPTVSGLHDLSRVLELARQLEVPAVVCVNKADINPDMCAQIEERAAQLKVPVLGRIRYDDEVTTAQVNKTTVVERGKGPAADDLRELWSRLERHLEK